MRKKRFIFLLLSVLCTGGMYADETGNTNGTSESMVTPDNIASYDNLTYAITQIGNLSTLETAKTDAEATVAKLETTENPTTTAVNKYSNRDKTGKLYFTEVMSTEMFIALTGDRSILQELEKLWIEEIKEYEVETCYYFNRYTKDWAAFLTGGNYSQEDLEGTIWSVMYFGILPSSLNLASGCSELRVYYKNSDGEITYQSVSENPSGLTGFLSSYIKNVKQFTDKIEGTKLPIGKEDELKALLGDGYEEWKTKYGEAKTAQKTAQAKYNEAKVLSDTKTWQIKADIIVPENATSISEWPTGRTLTGNYNHIINNSGHPLFAVNNGTIQTLFSVDIDIADEGTGRIRNCIIKSHYDDKYYIYGGVGTTGQGFDLLEKAIYSERDTYGMNLEDKYSVKKEVTPATRLYDARYANANNKTTTSIKVNIKDFSDKTEDSYDLIGCSPENNTKFNTVNRVNSIIYINDVDINDDFENDNYAKRVKDAWEQFSNIAIKDGDTYVYNKVRLSESQTRGFYVSETFTPNSITYDRKFDKNYMAVCLPFAFNAKNIGAEAYKFKDVRTEDNVLRLDLIEGQTVAANTPCFLIFKTLPESSAVFKNMPAGTEIVSTKGAKLSLGDNVFGNYGANQTYEQLQAASKGVENPVIYGIQTDKDTHVTKFVQMHPDSHMHAFRSFIALPGSSTPASRFTISLLDEDGNEEVTGIELVSMADNGTADFKAVGGRNAIEVTTGKACDVKVYTLNGALAKTARVEAGTTTLPMNAGMYVVNKTKVIVK